MIASNTKPALIRNIVLLALGVAVFFLFLASWKMLASQLQLSPLASHSAMKILLAVLAVSIGWAIGKTPRQLGFQPNHKVPWRRLFLCATALGAFSSFVLLATKATGIPMVKSFGLPGLIVSVWIISSISEEIYVRGLWQSLMSPSSGPLGSQSQVICSACIFGAMHLSLIFAGADWMTVIVIVSTTTLLGYLCALARQSTGSLYPAFWVHFAYNLGGLPGGILAVIAFGIPK